MTIQLSLISEFNTDNKVDLYLVELTYIGIRRKVVYQRAVSILRFV